MLIFDNLIKAWQLDEGKVLILCSVRILISFVRFYMNEINSFEGI